MPIGWAPRRSDVTQAPATLASMWEDIGRVDAALHSVFMRESAGAPRVNVTLSGAHMLCVQRHACFKALLDPSAKRCLRLDPRPYNSALVQACRVRRPRVRAAQRQTQRQTSLQRSLLSRRLPMRCGPTSTAPAALRRYLSAESGHRMASSTQRIGPSVLHSVQCLTLNCFPPVNM